MTHFLITPAIAARYGNAEHVDILRLQEHQNGLHVRARRTKRVLVNDDLASRVVMSGFLVKGNAVLGGALLRGEGRARPECACDDQERW